MAGSGAAAGATAAHAALGASSGTVGLANGRGSPPVEGRVPNMGPERGSGTEVSDSTQLETSLDIGPPRAALTDKGYDSKANRGCVPGSRHRAGDPVPVQCQEADSVPPKGALQGTRPDPASHAQAQRFKRIALRCEKTAESYSAFVAFACSLILNTVDRC